MLDSELDSNYTHHTVKFIQEIWPAPKILVLGQRDHVNQAFNAT